MQDAFFAAALPEIQPTDSDEYSSGALIIELLQGALEFSLANGFLYKELGPFLTLYLHTLGLVAYNREDTSVSRSTILLHLSFVPSRAIG